MNDYLQFKQKLELRKLLAPQLRQSLQILALPLLDLVQMVNEEMLTNPVLEEYQPPKDSLYEPKKDSLTESIEKIIDSASSPAEYDMEKISLSDIDTQAENQKRDFRLSLITKKVSLQDVLLRQLSIFTSNDEELAIGHELIGNIDENGYLRVNLEEIANTFKVTLEKIEQVLRIIQKFDPIGVGARNIPECLLVQLELTGQNEPLIEKIVQFHLEDVANKNYTKICKALKEPLENVEAAIKKLSKLNPKPGRNYSLDEAHQIIPDIIIEEELSEDEKLNKNNDEENMPPGPLRITINNENIPRLVINKYYRDMLKKNDLDPQTREFITNKLKRAYELLRAVTRRQSTLRRVVETIVGIQEQAIRQDLSFLKPLTFKEVANVIQMHESTVCRVVMNKYVQAPCGVVALKDFFPSKINCKNEEGQAISSQFVKSLIQELIAEEDKKHPLSDEDIVKILKEKNNLDVARRTIAKYREELKILSSSYRKVR